MIVRLISLCLLAGSIGVGVDAVAVMSVDLGSEWMKVAVVSPGVPMEIALNVESKRKTATAVAFRDGQRSFGEEALGVGVKFPELCYKYFLDLVGKGLSHPLVKRYQERFPYHVLEEDARGTVIFRHNETTTYSPEELLGMVLRRAISIAENFSGQKVKDAVVTVPAFFSQAERRAVLDAAHLAELNVFQLMNEHMAVALNYGMFRRKELNGTAKTIAFYGMGASSTWAAVVAFQTVKTKERGYAETHPQAQVLGLGFDRTLGGLELQLNVQRMIVDKFLAVKKTKRDPRDVPRAMGKIFKEAGKVKLVLSANKVYKAQIENVMDDEDLKVPFQREEFEGASADMFERIEGPLLKALNAAGITMGEIDQLILFGGGTRVPKIQEKLAAFSGKELGKSINTDEAAAMGAVYKAADMSSGFKVKKFITRDAVVFPIDVDFKRDVKTVKRALFGPMNNFPQKKIITFNKFVDDFSFDVNINNIDHLGQLEASYLTGLNLSKTSVAGVAEAFEKNKEDNVEPKGIKAHFLLDESGILTLESTEAVFERNITVEQQIEEEKEKEKAEQDKEKANAAEETWSKLGDKISSFFGGGDDKEKKKEEEEEKEKEGEKEGEKKDETKKKKEEEEKKKKEVEEKKKKEEEKKKKKAEPKKPLITTIKAPLKTETELLDLSVMNETVKAESLTKLRAWADHDAAIKLRATAFNDLESFVIDMQANLWEELYEKLTTEEEREKIRAKCTEISEWLYDEYSDEMPIDTLKEKLKEVQDLTAGLAVRVREDRDGPEAMEAVKQMLNASNNYHEKAVNSTAVVDGYFTQAELDALGKLINETGQWLEKAEKKMEEEPKHQMPTITASKIAEQGMKLDREIKYLGNKAKIAKRKAEEEAATKKLAEQIAKAAKKKAEEEKAKNATKADQNATNSTLEEPQMKSDEGSTEKKTDEVKDDSEAAAKEGEDPKEPVEEEESTPPEGDGQPSEKAEQEETVLPDAEEPKKEEL